MVTEGPFPCAGHSVTFFPTRTGDAAAMVEAARGMCAECPRETDCGEHAIATPSEHGVWGGLTERERRDIRRRRAAAA